MDLSGKVISQLAEVSGSSKSGNAWRKQEYIVETGGQYPKKVCFNIWGAKIAQFNIQNGEFINIGVDLESREYNGRWYTDVRAWKVERPGAAGVGGSAPQQAVEGGDPFANTGQMEDPFASNSSPSDGADDLPF